MKDGLMYFTDTYITIGGLIIFFLLFLAVMGWCALPMNRVRFQYFESLPLENGEKHES